MNEEANERLIRFSKSNRGQRVIFLLSAITVLSLALILALPIVYLMTGGSATFGYTGHMTNSPNDKLYFLRSFSGYSAVSKGLFIFVEIMESLFVVSILLFIFCGAYSLMLRRLRVSVLGQDPAAENDKVIDDNKTEGNSEMSDDT